MSACRSCEQPIIWAETESGKATPLNAEPDAAGFWVIVGGKVRKATEEDRKLHRPTYTNHFATCPDAKMYRRRTDK